MTNRYVTKAEREGTKRRMAAYRERKARAGITQYSFMLTEPEVVTIRFALAVWRGEELSKDFQRFSEDQLKGAKVLTPIYPPKEDEGEPPEAC